MVTAPILRGTMMEPDEPPLQLSNRLLSQNGGAPSDAIFAHRYFLLCFSKPALGLPKGALRVAFSLHNQWGTIDRRDGALRCLERCPRKR
jgi:hypothetical protein